MIFAPRSKSLEVRFSQQQLWPLAAASNSAIASEDKSKQPTAGAERPCPVQYSTAAITVPPLPSILLTSSASSGGDSKNMAIVSSFRSPAKKAEQKKCCWNACDAAKWSHRKSRGARGTTPPTTMGDQETGADHAAGGGGGGVSPCNYIAVLRNGCICV